MKKFKFDAFNNLCVLQRTNKLLLGPGKHRKLFFVGFILSCVATQMWAVDSWMFGQLTNKLAGQKSFFSSWPVYLIVFALFGIDVIPRSLKYLVKRVELRLRIMSTEQTQSSYWRSFAKYDLQDRENTVMLDALNNASRNQNVLQEVFSIQWILAISLLTVVVSAFMLATIAWWFFFVVLLMVLPRMYFTRKRKIRGYLQEKQLNETQRYKGSLESYLSAKESMLNGSRNHFLGLFESLRRRFNVLGYKNNNYYARINYVGDIWFYLLFAGIMLCIATWITRGTVPIGAMFIVFGSIGRMYTELDLATNALIDLELAAKRAKDFFLIIDSTPAITDVPQAIDINNTIAPTIEFRNVHFKYPGSDQVILDDVSFIINAGETVGLIAKNGEGKTTIGMLLLRFYDPTSGSIYINNIDLRLIKRSSLLRITGALFQDFSILKTTIKHSIVSANPQLEVTDFHIWSLLEKVGLKEYVEKLPNKLNHKVDRVFKDSVKLSGGQSQKLALAGIFHRDPKLVVLDEFTSALDPEAECEIIEQYRMIAKGKTSLVISHRYMSLKIVDRVIVLQGGKIVESGRKSELLAIDNGVFKKLYKAAELAHSLN